MKEHAMTIHTTHTSPATTAPARNSKQSRPTSRIARGLSAAGLVWGLAGAAILPGAAAAQTAPPAATTAIQVPHAAEQYLPTPLVFGNYSASAAAGSAYSITGTFAKRPGNVLRFFGFQATTLQTVRSAALEIELKQASYVNDEFALEYSVDDWRTAHALTTFGAANPPPAALTLLRFTGLESVVATPELARKMEVRQRAVRHVNQADTFSLTIGQLRQVLQGS
jgi:hypothetical protein